MVQNIETEADALLFVIREAINENIGLENGKIRKLLKL